MKTYYMKARNLFVSFGLLLGTVMISAEEQAKKLADTGFNQVKVQKQELVTGGQPSLKELQLLAKSGVKTVINLRSQNEFDGFDEAAEANKLGLKYINIPVAGASGITMENAKKLDQALAQTDELTFVHCASGNRVGALIALRENLLKGNTIDESIELGKKAGLKSLESKTLETMQQLKP